MTQTPERRQAEAREIGEQMLARAWAWLSAPEPDAQPTVYRCVFAAVQIILSAVPPGDEEMALAAVGSVLGTISTQRPGVDVMALTRHGFDSALEADLALRGPLQ